jgi:hypothetical protein
LKAYLKWGSSWRATSLNTAFIENFNFYSTTLRGTEKQNSLRRGVETVKTL